MYDNSPLALAVSSGLPCVPACVATLCEEQVTEAGGKRHTCWRAAVAPTQAQGQLVNVAGVGLLESPLDVTCTAVRGSDQAPVGARIRSGVCRVV